jgi:hypothetical protein
MRKSVKSSTASCSNLCEKAAGKYESVKEFAADIERFLRNEPVRAESFAGEENKTLPKNDFDSL